VVFFSNFSNVGTFLAQSQNIPTDLVSNDLEKAQKAQAFLQVESSLAGQQQGAQQPAAPGAPGGTQQPLPQQATAQGQGIPGASPAAQAALSSLAGLNQQGPPGGQ